MTPTMLPRSISTLMPHVVLIGFGLHASAAGAPLVMNFRMGPDRRQFLLGHFWLLRRR